MSTPTPILPGHMTPVRHRFDSELNKKEEMKVEYDENSELSFSPFDPLDAQEALTEEQIISEFPDWFKSNVARLIKQFPKELQACGEHLDKNLFNKSLGMLGSAVFKGFVGAATSNPYVTFLATLITFIGPTTAFKVFGVSFFEDSASYEFVNGLAPELDARMLNDDFDIATRNVLNRCFNQNKVQGIATQLLGENPEPGNLLQSCTGVADRIDGVTMEMHPQGLDTGQCLLLNNLVRGATRECDSTLAKGLEGLKIYGIVIGGIAGVALLGVCLLYCGRSAAQCYDSLARKLPSRNRRNNSNSRDPLISRNVSTTKSMLNSYNLGEIKSSSQSNSTTMSHEQTQPIALSNTAEQSELRKRTKRHSEVGH